MQGIRMKTKFYAKLYDPRTGKCFYLRGDDIERIRTDIESYLYIGCKIINSNFSI